MELLTYFKVVNMEDSRWSQGWNLGGKMDSSSKHFYGPDSTKVFADYCKGKGVN